MCTAWDDHKKAGIREGEERGRKGILISVDQEKFPWR